MSPHCIEMGMKKREIWRRDMRNKMSRMVSEKAAQWS